MMCSHSSGGHARAFKNANANALATTTTKGVSGHDRSRVAKIGSILL